MSDNKSFRSEGLTIRSREKPLNETDSRALATTINTKVHPQIFLNTDGQLYFRDNDTVDPIPLKQLKNYYKRIKTVDGELRFYDIDLIGYVSLSQIVETQGSVRKSNSIVSSSFKTVEAPENFSALDVYKSFKGDYSISGVIPEADITSSKNYFENKFLNDYLRFFEGETILSSFVKNFMEGVAVFKDIPPVEVTDCFEVTVETYSVSAAPDIYDETYDLQNLKSFLGENQVCLVRDVDGNPKSLELAGKPLKTFVQYVYDKFDRYDGIGKFVSKVFGPKVTTETETYSGYYYEENGYSTISTVPTSATPLTGSTTISGAGVFSGYSAISPFQDILLTEVTKAMFYEMRTLLLTRYIELFKSNDILTANYSAFRDKAYILNHTDFSFDTFFDIINSEFKDESSSLYNSAITSIKIAIQEALSVSQTPIMNKITSITSETVGGLLSDTNFVKMDYTELYNEWFDIPGLYYISPSVKNEYAISLVSTFSIDLQQKDNVRYEFRLIDTVSNIELDRLVLDTGYVSSMEEVGLMFNDVSITYPIMLSYFGPVPTFKCDQKTYQSCAANSDIKSYIQLSSDDCRSEDVITSSDGFKVIANRFLSNVQTQTTLKDNLYLKDIETPRIFRVQFRMVGSNSSLYTVGANKVINVKKWSDFTFSPLSSEMRISLNIYNTGETKGKKVIKYGQIQFVNQNRMTVPVDFFTTFTDTPQYSISLQPNKNIKVWWDNKRKDSFDIVAEKTFSGIVDWLVTQSYTDFSTVTGSEKKLPSCFVDSKPGFNKSNFDLFFGSATIS